MIRCYFLLGIAGLWSTLALANQQIERRAPLAADATVEISNVSGSISVSGWNRDEVEVTGSMGEHSSLEFDSNTQRATIKIATQRFFWWSNESATLNVRVPIRSRLVVAAVSADTTVQAVHGSLKLQSVSGGINAEAWSEDLEAKTVSGDVTVSGHQGNAVFDLSSVSGDFKISGIGGEINVSTVSGNANLKLGSVTRSKLHTTSGDLTFLGELAKQARVDAETVSGDVELILRGTRDAEYELRTFSGDIENCFGPSVRGTHSPGQDLRFTEGGGSARVRTKTLSGKLRLCDR